MDEVSVLDNALKILRENSQGDAHRGSVLSLPHRLKVIDALSLPIFSRMTGSSSW